MREHDDMEEMTKTREILPFPHGTWQWDSERGCYLNKQLTKHFWRRLSQERNETEGEAVELATAGMQIALLHQPMFRSAMEQLLRLVEARLREEKRGTLVGLEIRATTKPGALDLRVLGFFQQVTNA